MEGNRSTWNGSAVASAMFRLNVRSTWNMSAQKQAELSFGGPLTAKVALTMKEFRKTCPP